MTRNEEWHVRQEWGKQIVQISPKIWKEPKLSIDFVTGVTFDQKLTFDAIQKFLTGFIYKSFKDEMAGLLPAWKEINQIINLSEMAGLFMNCKSKIKP